MVAQLRIMFKEQRSHAAPRLVFKAPQMMFDAAYIVTEGKHRLKWR